eukprot:6874972-Alexandrium_andersonii.AAC.1
MRLARSSHAAGAVRPHVLTCVPIPLPRTRDCSVGASLGWSSAACPAVACARSMPRCPRLPARAGY